MSAYEIGTIGGAILATFLMYRLFIWLVTHGNKLVKMIIRHVFITLSVASVSLMLLNFGKDGDVSDFNYYLYSAIALGVMHFIAEFMPDMRKPPQ